MGQVPTEQSFEGTTRYLCAAVHLDEEFCNKAITEFLVEPVRAIPPSPGVDSVAVLREAVAARTRRRIRDGLLLALLSVLVLVNFLAASLWVCLGALVLSASRANRTRRTLATAAVILVGIQAVELLLLAIIQPQLFQRIMEQPALYIDIVTTLEFTAGNIFLSLLIGALLLLVLIVDGAIVARLKVDNFRRDRFEPDTSRVGAEWERLIRILGQIIRTLGHNFLRVELDRVARSDRNSQATGQADVIVYRGYNPFIGAGAPAQREVIALPLEPSESDTEPAPINVNDLHRHVAECLAALRSSSPSLSPGRRLAQLRQREQILVPADRLLFNRFAPMQPPLLPDLFRPPLTHLPLDDARRLAENPLEWARYYSCFRVESWDRDLVTSCYLHIGTDQRMLYLEWTYCILLPVHPRYRSIDDAPESPWVISRRSLSELVVLPVNVTRRIRSTFRRNASPAQRAGEVVPDRYGAFQSLRELAADTDAQTYFQDADTNRYVKIIDHALVRAVGQFLEEKGYSVVEFMRIADPIINNFNIQGNVTGSVVGSGNKVQNLQTNIPPSR